MKTYFVLWILDIMTWEQFYRQDEEVKKNFFLLYTRKWAIGHFIPTRNLISVTKNATFSFASIQKG